MKLCVLLFFVSVDLVLGQFGFFPRRDDRQTGFNLVSNIGNQLHNTFNGFFKVRGRQRPAIITEQDREMADQPYYPNQEFNRPVIFPTTNPQERPVDTQPGLGIPNQYNPNRQDQYPSYDQPNYDTNPGYTDKPVSFPVEPSSPGSDYDTGNVNYDQGGYQDNAQTTPREVQESSSLATNSPSDVGNDYNGLTTKAPGLEGTTEGNKYENRFGEVENSGSLPTLPDTPSFESRNVNFGTSEIFAETCQTVENEIGSCINVNECEPYLKLLKEFRTNPAVVKLLRSAQCGFDGNDPKVCCPRPGLPTSAPQSTTTTTTTTTAPTTKSPAPVVEPSGKSIGAEDFVPAFLDPPVCGFSNATLSRVVGGVNAKLGDFPWMALLGYKKRTNPVQWKCGGSLVTQKHVVTAAHCVHNKENELYVVRLGELDITRDDDGASPIDVFIKHIIKHEQYSPTAFTNDIAVIVLQKEVEITDLIRPICLPKTAELRANNFEDFNPLVAGWGNIEQRGPAAPHLQVVQLPVVSNDFCKQAYRNYTAQKIDERVLCAGYRNGGKDSCSGDSGGPLMQPIWNSKTLKTYIFQIGVVSFGKGCAQAGFPGVYSRVTHFLPWLEQKVIGHTI